MVVATASFVRLANSIKNSMNLEDLPLVVVTHPLGEPTVAQAKAREVAAQIVQSVVG